MANTEALQSRVTGVAADVQLLLPADDVDAPELSIVIPALDEELTIEEFVRWCKEGISRAGVEAEILIVDSSTDRTAEIALAGGARVLKTPRRGLGRAYIDALPHVRGDYIIMGDADCTYDFRDITQFVELFRQGYEFIMGSRFKGGIEPGAMPALHRYFGTPLATWILNRMYASKFSDIACGMRGIRTDAFRRMGMRSQSWEYASELVLRSVHMHLRTTEVPVRFFRDPPGRLSHHRRRGWLSPWKAGWTNLRAMFVYGADFFVYRPGIVLTCLGLVLTLPLTFGPITIGPVEFSLYWMLLGVTLTVVGLQSFFSGCLAQMIYDETGAARRRWSRVFAYNRSIAVSVALFVTGVVLMSFLVITWLRNGLRIEGFGAYEYMAITGLLLMIAAFTLFVFTLLVHALAARLRAGDPFAQP
ncbi:MAG TPA: glycosyltransferase [Acidimicrobiia bacterium]|nr:glycosyltransferase [Acidimicrobiia bacterium]